MLKATTTETAIVVNDRSLLPICEANGIRAVHIDAATGDPMTIAGSKVIIVDDFNAYSLADRLIEQGMNRRDVTCIDLQTNESGANELLTGGDLGYIRECARPWYFNMVRSLEDAQDDPDDRIRIPSGLAFLDKHIQWRKNEVCILTGPYGCGKSLLAQVLAIKWAQGEGGKYPDGSEREVAAWLCTWEDDPLEQKDQVYRHICHGVKDPDKFQVEKARALAKRIWHTHKKFTRTRDLKWYLETVRMLHELHGTNFFVLDPWSEFDHERYSHENETDYCKRVMKELGKLANELGVIFIVVTHLPKSKYCEDGSIKPFRVADAMGSVQFGSSASRGICILRAKVKKHLDDDRDYLVVHFDKIKIERNMGRKGTVALRYHEDRHALEYCPDASRIAAEMWSGARKEGQ